MFSVVPLQTEKWPKREVWEVLRHAWEEKEVMKGKVCSVQKQQGQDQEFAVIQLDDLQEFDAICFAEDFDEHQFKSLAGFVGHDVDVVVQEVDVEQRRLRVSRVNALKKLQSQFWENRKTGDVVEGRISGWNENKQILYLLVQGVTTYLHLRDWSYGYVQNVKEIARLGNRVQVKIIDMNQEQKRVRVGRKPLLKDPWENAESSYKLEDLHLGKVSMIHPKHGIFVRLQEGLEILCYPAKRLQKPVPGLDVTVKITRMDSVQRRGRGIIVNYPHGGDHNENR